MKIPFKIKIKILIIKFNKLIEFIKLWKNWCVEYDKQFKKITDEII